MIKHQYTEPAETNFQKLEERLMQINYEKQFTYFQFLRNLWNPLLNKKNIPTLIMATGGSKAVAYYLKMIMENNKLHAEVIEPRDYFNKENIEYYKRLIAISKSGTTNGITEALHTFKGSKYLIAENYLHTEDDYIESGYFGQDLEPLFDVVNWSNGYYTDKEKSFVSLVSTLAPMLILLDLTCCNGRELSSEQLRQINEKLKLLISKSQDKVNSLQFSFSDTDIVQIISGYDTKTSETILESNLAETGSAVPLVHDKGSYCHGRSNSLFKNPTSPVIYLSHKKAELDEVELNVLKENYANVFLFDTFAEDENKFWKEYYLSLQMMYLSRKIASDKQIDLTQPEYNPNVVKKLYKFKGGM